MPPMPAVSLTDSYDNADILHTFVLPVHDKTF